MQLLFFLAITGIVTVGMQLLFFLIAYTCRFDKVTDFAGSTNFIVLVLLSLLGAKNTSPRAIMVTAMVLVCRLELAVYLLYRVLKRGKDDRFDAMRGNFFSFLGRRCKSPSLATNDDQPSFPFAIRC
jgi:steroid 5-alpha reductase family enzyme